MIKDLFKSIDSKDVNEFLTFCSDDVSFVFGNADPLNGKDSVKAMLESFNNSIDSVSHNIFKVQNQENDIIVQGEVSYTRLDNTILKVPFCNIFKMKNSLIKDYLIYVDTSMLYA